MNEIDCAQSDQDFHVHLIICFDIYNASISLPLPLKFFIFLLIKVVIYENCLLEYSIKNCLDELKYSFVTDVISAMLNNFER